MRTASGRTEQYTFKAPPEDETYSVARKIAHRAYHTLNQEAQAA